jgi:urease gamma subunit
VADVVGTVKLECLFGDGTRVLHVDRPLGPGTKRTA